jgi:hypothetical protein
MKSKFLLLFIFTVSCFYSFSQNVYTGKVESVLPYGGQNYSFISENGTNNYYKTSPYISGALTQGQSVELYITDEGTNSETIEVKASSLDEPLFCERTSEGNMHSERDSIDLSKYVSFNSQHDILVFETWEDVKSLETQIFELSRNYPFNRGNEELILNTLDSIREHGWHLLNNYTGEKVNLNQFGVLLEESYPLSTNVLKRIVELVEANDLDPDFSLNTLSSNLPYTSSLEYSIMNSTLDSVLKSELIRINDVYLDAPNHAYNDFLSTFPEFNSLYSRLKAVQLTQLESGMDPANRSFDSSIIHLPFERLIMNSKKEVWIEGVLYKFYRECLAIAIQNPVDQAAQSLGLLNENGRPTIPEMEEQISGIPNAEIENYIPSEYMVFNPEEYDPLGGVDDDPNYNTALQEYNLVSGCPKSNFTYSLYAGDDFTVDFSNQTNLSNVNFPPDDFIQYWKFGDGTGSFQKNPSHKFPGYGTYYVTLTTFLADCGCWHVHTAKIIILEPHLKEGNPDCPFESIDVTTHWSNDPLKALVDVVPNIGAAVLPNTQVLTYLYEFFTVAGTPIYDDQTNLEFSFHDFPQDGDYKVRVTATWNGGCISTSEFHEFTLYTPVPEPEGCDQKHRVKDTYSADYQGNSYRLKIDDLARGTWGTESWKRITGSQVLYRKKPGQWTWKLYSAWHEVHRTGYYYDVVDNSCETGYYLLDNGPYKSCYGEYHQWISHPLPPFQNQFGLDHGSVKFNHKVYIYGAMVTGVNWTVPNVLDQDYYNCHNPWGHLLFNRNVWVGQP